MWIPFLKRVAIDRAGGNPLFLIELAESLRRANQVVIDRQRAFLKSPMAELKLPSGVYDVLASRLDAFAGNRKNSCFRSQLSPELNSHFCFWRKWLI